MRLTVNDIATFAYCPFLYWERGGAGTSPPLSVFEQTLRDTVLSCEERCMKNDSYVNPRKLGNTWTRLWWPAATKAGLGAKEIEQLSTRAMFKLADYCRYDISSAQYATIGTQVPFEVKLERDLLIGEIDMIKAEVNSAHKTATIISFSKENLTPLQLANDLAVLSTVYALQSLKRDIVYMRINPSEGGEKLHIVSSFFDINAITMVGRTIEYLAAGINRKISFTPAWLCEGCNRCRSKS